MSFFYQETLEYEEIGGDMELEQDAFAPLKGPVGRRRQAWCLGVGLIAGAMFGGVVGKPIHFCRWCWFPPLRV